MCHPHFTQTRVVLLRETDNKVSMGKSEWRSFHKYWVTNLLLLLLHIHSTGYSHRMKIKDNTTQTMKRCIKANIVMETAGGGSAIILTSSWLLKLSQVRF